MARNRYTMVLQSLFTRPCDICKERLLRGAYIWQEKDRLRRFLVVPRSKCRCCGCSHAEKRIRI